MKWTSVKNMMLGLLIVMNVFMTGVVLVRRYSSERIPPSVRTAAAEALENGGVSCPAELLPEKYITARSVRAEFTSAAELSRIFFGEQLAFQTEGRTLIARKDGAELWVEEKVFRYSDSRAAVPSSERELRRALKKLGFDMRRAGYDRESGSFYRAVDGIPVFDMYLRASLGEDGTVCSVEACWPRVSCGAASEAGISVISCLPSIGEAFSGRVKAIETGYSLVKNENTASFSLEPSWRVTMENGDGAVFFR